ncbi:hypothetical protein BASA50_005961 [Batrachochytrium salamandrivorans]|uniref:Uncharacterized protein n=2 Tax=Batrachochytrium salamandrivorans TaxID=1357716 RepID=A0ABQ8FAZ0_9FUNG|nr:hypothetical protein BASA50_005961 [Batrachochytrium salamandrivorans]
MQFFHLFSLVVVASYAAAHPQPAGLSEKHSNNADATLASGLEARSYQPELNSQRDSATLVSLERRGSYEESSRKYRKYEFPHPPRSTPRDILRDIYNPFDKAEAGSWFLSPMIKEFGTNLGDVPENVKAAGAAVDGNTGNFLVEYAQKSLQVTDILKEWVEEAEESLVAVIKAGLDEKEYSKVEPLLKDAGEKLAADASYNLQQVAAALLNIQGKVGPVKPEVDAVQGAFERVFEGYKLYFATLQPQLARFETGKDLNRHLSVGVQSLVEFSLRQEELYAEIIEKLETAPSQ